MVNVGKYTVRPMDPMGWINNLFIHFDEGANFNLHFPLLQGGGGYPKIHLVNMKIN